MRLTKFMRVPRQCRSTRIARILLAVAVLAAGSRPMSAATSDNEGFAIRSGTAVLSSASPRQAGKVPVVLIHGMLGSRGLWSAMIEQLSADPAIAGEFQLLTFGYDTLQPIADSARELREALAGARRRFDPEGRDASFDRIVLVGHSLGGLVAKAAANRDVDAPLATDWPRRAARPCVGRHIFIATPHRGTPIDQGALRSVSAGLARRLSPSLAARRRCDKRAARAVTSIDELTADHPLLADLERSRAAAGLPFHSIIAALSDTTASDATDGLVPVSSARLAGARSEVVVRGPHLCHHDPNVIREVHRILGEHAADAAGVARLQREDPPPAQAPQVAAGWKGNGGH